MKRGDPATPSTERGQPSTSELAAPPSRAAHTGNRQAPQARAADTADSRGYRGGPAPARWSISSGWRKHL